MSNLGILTMAFGDERFCRLAENLAYSASYFAPSIPRAIITDTAHADRFAPLFETVVALDPTFGNDNRQKLYLYDYSPFEETLFIDADALILRPIEHLISEFRAHGDIGVLGGKRWVDGWRYSLRTAGPQFGIEWIAQFNGGCYYLRRSDKTETVVRLAQDHAIRWEETCCRLELRGPNDARSIPRISDETAFSLAMVAHDVEPLYDYDERRMIGPVQMRAGRLSWNLLKGECACRCDGVEWHPTIGHFFLNSDRGFHYRRETRRLQSAVVGGRWSQVATTGAAGAATAVYGLLTAAYFGRDKALRRSPSVRFMQAGLPLDYFGGRMIRGKRRHAATKPSAVSDA